MAGVDPLRGASATPQEALPGRAPPRRTFGAALARARCKPAALAAPGQPRAAGGVVGAGGVLALRRREADGTLTALGRRRDEADPERTPSSRQVIDEPGHGDGRAAAGPTALGSAAAVDRVAFELAQAAGRTAVALALGGGVRLRLTQAPGGGVEVKIEAPRALAGSARGELPGLVEALRARGVGVRSASVLEAEPPGQRTRARALTPRRGSATTAGG